MMQITLEQMNKLKEHGYIKNTREGIVNSEGFPVGFYRTNYKRYIEDKYAEIAQKL